MILHHGRINADVVKGLHRLHHVNLALTDESFRELWDRARNVSEVDVEDLASATEVANRVQDVFGHRADRSRAKGQAVGVARHNLDDTPHRLVTPEDPRDPTDWRDGRVVGMKCHLDSRFLGDRYDRLEEVGHIVPDLIIAGFHRPGHRHTPQGESFLGRKWLIGKKIKKELDKPEGISHAKMV